MLLMVSSLVICGILIQVLKGKTHKIVIAVTCWYIACLYFMSIVSYTGLIDMASRNKTSVCSKI